MSDHNSQLQHLVDEAQRVMAHAWMVRTFIKHCDEVEDFPELMQVVRTIFDTSRALETRINNPADYFKMLGKKLAKLRNAVHQFALDAPLASTHTNFQQAVISAEHCVSQLQRLQEEYSNIKSTAAL